MNKSFSSPREPISIHDTRKQIMDNFNHVIKILDIGINSALERALQIA